MKNIVFLILLLTAAPTFSQSLKKTRKTVQVITQQDFYLNSGGRALLGGRSRVSYKIDLPENTIAWYYVFTTRAGQSPAPTINLLAQITKLFDPTGLSALTTSAILAPTGSNSCDIYLMDYQNANAFLNKADQNGGTFNFYQSGSRQNFKSGTVEINDVKSGTVYLGFKNPSGVEGINVTFEAVAITEEVEVIKKTEAQQKAELYGSLGWESFEKGSYDQCISLSEKALILYSDMPWVKCNIALAHLVKNDSLYMDAYVNAISACKSSDTPKQYLILAKKDIIESRNRNIPMPHADEIIELIDMELK